MGLVYFHSPCFDGIVSAILTSDFLRNYVEWAHTDIEAVDYDLKSSWLSIPFEEQVAVVDFLYHPKTAFWADHHSTTFLNDTVQNDYLQNKDAFHIFDSEADSCAELLWWHFKNVFDYRTTRYQPLVEYADKIDAAKYSSPEEAVFGAHPALQINRSLALNDDVQKYSERLVDLLSQESAHEVLHEPVVSKKAQQATELTKKGLARIHKSIRVTQQQTIVFKVSSGNAIIPRYGQFLYEPEGLYSVGLVYGENIVKITAMRNPWKDFNGVHLGKLFEKYGGGGHKRVASVVLDQFDSQAAESDLWSIVRDIETSSVRGVVDYG